MWIHIFFENQYKQPQRLLTYLQSKRDWVNKIERHQIEEITKLIFHQNGEFSEVQGESMELRHLVFKKLEQFPLIK